MTAVFTTGGDTSLTVTIRRANGRLEIVNFEAPILFGNVGKSKYTTSDKEIAECLKKHPSFGSLFYLESEVVPEEATAVEDDGVTDYRAMCANQEGIVEELSVVDVATAQNWCQRVHGAVFRGRKADTIKAEAAQKYNTVFPNFN